MYTYYVLEIMRQIMVSELKYIQNLLDFVMNSCTVLNRSTFCWNCNMTIFQIFDNSRIHAMGL